MKVKDYIREAAKKAKGKAGYVNEMGAAETYERAFPDVSKSDEFVRIGKNLSNVGSKLKMLLSKIHKASQPDGILGKHSEPYKERIIEAEDLGIAIEDVFKEIKNLLESTKEQLDDWNNSLEILKTKSNVFIDAAQVNPAIELVKSNIDGSNAMVRNSLWFNKDQGDKMSVYKKAQLAYRDHFDCVSAYYKITDSLHEQTKNNPDEKRRIIKSPSINNLMTDATLKTLKEMEIEKIKSKVPTKSIGISKSQK